MRVSREYPKWLSVLEVSIIRGWVSGGCYVVGHGSVNACEWVSVDRWALTFASPSFSVLTDKKQGIYPNG